MMSAGMTMNDMYIYDSAFQNMAATGSAYAAVASRETDASWERQSIASALLGPADRQRMMGPGARGLSLPRPRQAPIRDDALE